MTVYPPREDSLFLKEFLEQMDLEGKKTLDMGTGSGVQAIVMEENGAEVTAVDVDPEAVERVRRKNQQGRDIRAVKSDLFENLDERFDLVSFNPPYLPGETEDLEGEEAWRGGERGKEVLENFLEQVDEYLTESGKAVVLLSSRSDYRSLVERFDLELVESRELWFETIHIAFYD